MEGWIYEMTWDNWVGMAAVVAMYCVCGWRLGRS